VSNEWIGWNLSRRAEWAARVTQADNEHQGGCVRHRRIERWADIARLRADGFLSETKGLQGTIGFGSDEGGSFISLRLAQTPDFAGEYTASRIKEIGGSLDPHDRGGWWQPGPSECLQAELVVRFEKPDPLPGVTETLMLWNDPFGSRPVPLTAVGLTRSQASQGRYAALVAQDLVTQPELSGLMQVEPVPAWLAIDEWHTVRLTLTREVARVEVAQNRETCMLILEVALPRLPEPLGFEFSLDNEVFPGSYGPVTTPDRLDIRYFDIGLYRRA
jgi:hypothetical protein